MRKLIGFAAGCCLVAFLLGIIVGVAIDVKQRKNTVRMAVQYDTTEVYVAPFVGDTVEWFKVGQDGTFTQVEADFGNEAWMSPCDPKTSDQFHCRIRKPDHDSDRYFYSCKQPYSCIDPGGGPQSSTGLDYMSADGPQFWPVFFFDLKGVFNLQQNPVAVPVAAEGGISPKGIARTIIHMRVGCPGNTLTVYGPDGKATNSIDATPNDQIVWITALNPLTITDNNHLCSNNSSGLAKTGCIIDANAKESHTYTASSADTNCSSSANSSTQTVVLPK
jgi:hypothetical protein